MKYSILLIANNLYFKLLNICLKSICSTCNMDNINNIFIADLGIRKKYLNKLLKINNKIKIINTNKNIGKSKAIFSKNWINAVSQKTLILRTLIEDNNVPVIMLDSDTIIFEDFSNVIDLSYDIQICKRSYPFTRRDGQLIEYIASFLSINNINSISFLDKWISRIEERIYQKMDPPFETPAMVDTILYNNELNIGFLEDNIVSCDNNYFFNITKIMHAKSNKKREYFSILRFAKIKNIPYKKISYLFNKIEKILLLFFIFLYKIKRKLFSE